jgi:clan AA aspartic protease (TIGR02281 family)
MIFTANARAAVSFIKEGDGTFKVPVLINGAITLNFTVDSGAADVSIPADVVLTLMRTGTITQEDFLGNQTYRLADGSTVRSKIFRIRLLKVGDQSVQNVQASISDVNGGLLLGQSFLGRFKSWSVDNTRKLLTLGDDVASPQIPTSVQTPAEHALQEGNAALERSDYAAAEGFARQALAGGKGSPSAYDARFLLAQALAGQRKSVDAAVAYGDTYNSSKQGSHAQDALVGYALNLTAIGEKRAACDTLDILRKQFPILRADIGNKAAAARQTAGCS